MKNSLEDEEMLSKLNTEVYKQYAVCLDCEKSNLM